MSAHEALRWAQAARATYERELSRVGITGLHKAAIGDVLEGVRHVEALAALGAARVEGPPVPLADLIRDVCEHVAELPDRTSPDDYPDMMLVTADELEAIIEGAFERAGSPPPAPQGGDE